MNQLQIASQNANRAVPDLTSRRAALVTHWAVVHTQPKAEAWAQANVARAGFHTFLPLFAANQHQRRFYRTGFQLLPLFPRYLFVRLTHDNWTPLKRTPGVNSILMHDGKPAYANAAAVEALQAGEAARRTIHPPNTRWSPGDPCRLVGGPFQGQEAVIASIRKQASVWIIALGEMRKITMPMTWIDKRK